MRLHREYDEVLLAGIAGFVHCLDLGGFDFAVVPFELEAALLDSRQVDALIDDRHVLTGEGELRRHQATNGAGANHANAFGPRRASQKVRAGQFLIEAVAERADALDRNFDDIVGIAHHAGAKRGAAGDHVARHERHVPGNRSDELVRREEHIRDWIVLHFLAVEDSADDELRRVDFRGDSRAEHPEGVKALCAGPLIKGGEFLHQVDGGDVVHAGIAEDVIFGLRLAHVEALFADHHPKLAFVQNPAVVGLRATNGLAGRMIGIGRLEEIQRLIGPLKIILRRELMKIVPQADHLARLARREHAHVRKLDGFAGGFRAREHVAVVNGDDPVLQGPKADPAVPLKPDPLRHRRFSLITTLLSRNVAGRRAFGQALLTD